MLEGLFDLLCLVFQLQCFCVVFGYLESLYFLCACFFYDLGFWAFWKYVPIWYQRVDVERTEVWFTTWCWHHLLFWSILHLQKSFDQFFLILLLQKLSISLEVVFQNDKFMRIGVQFLVFSQIVPITVELHLEKRYETILQKHLIVQNLKRRKVDLDSLSRLPEKLTIFKYYVDLLPTFWHWYLLLFLRNRLPLFFRYIIPPLTSNYNFFFLYFRLRTENRFVESISLNNLFHHFGFVFLLGWLLGNQRLRLYFL